MTNHIPKILIGSSAMRHWFEDFNRTAKDKDYAVNIEIGFDKDPEGKIRIEYLYNPILKPLNKENIATPEQLLSLKMSHIFWDINWEKHMYDIQFLLSKGVKLKYSLFKELKQFFDIYLPKVHRSDLKMTKEEFFSNAVNKDTNQHDELHYKLTPTPAFTKILKDNEEVEVCFNKFESLSQEEKFDVVIEETVVMAFERYSDTNYRKNFHKQLKDNIIKHFPEPIALFAVENYIELTKYYKLKIEEMFNKLNK